MIARNIQFSALAAFLLFSTPAIGAETKAVAIIEDQKAKAVRIAIDGKEIAVIDKTGLHVNGEVACSSVVLTPFKSPSDTESGDAK